MIQLGRHQLHHGDALDVLRSIPDASVDAVVTDPPYGLGKEPDAIAMLRDWLVIGSHVVTGAGFMGRAWDAFVPQPRLWADVLRVLKPGGHALVFAGTRTQDLMGLSLRIAGFEARDCLQWIHGQGFPKHPSALKPAYEPVLLCRKPLSGTIVENVRQHGTGSINIDACRIATGDPLSNHSRSSESAVSKGIFGDSRSQPSHQTEGQVLGRWPANVVLDEESGAALGGPSRFFYCAKASRSERGPTNNHPTVKPLALMRWLCKLVTPPGGVILDPFAGSGTTLLAADALGFTCVAVEREFEHVSIIRNRYEESRQSPSLFAD